MSLLAGGVCLARQQRLSCEGGRVMESKILSAEVLYPPKEWDKSDIAALTISELTRSNKELEQFAFVAAHDLQEPLKVAYSYLQLFDKKYKGKLDDNADKMMVAIIENTERLQNLVQSLLKYSQAGRTQIQYKGWDSSVLLNRAIENLKVSIEESAAVIRHEGCHIIWGDEIQLTQLFQNLIGNAIKFRKKEEAPAIYISVRQEDAQWVFAVQDNGIGIAPEDTQRIFDLFRRLHPQSEYTGCGIGLALCKKIVESHRGRIWVESEIGKGTTVYFTIPKTRKLFFNLPAGTLVLPIRVSVS